MKNKKTSDYHVIYTSHPYFAELGLSVMTTGSLAEWWNAKNSEGVYINRRHLNKKEGLDDTFADKQNYGALFGFRDGQYEDTEFFWYGWKPNSEQTMDGRYLRQNLSDKYGLDAPEDKKGDGGSFSYDSEIGTVELNNVDWNEYTTALPIVGLTIDEEFNYTRTTFLDEFEQEGGLRMGLEIEPLYGLIQMNRHYNSFNRFFPRRLWKEDDPETIGNEDPSFLWGEHELLADIKASKGGLPAVSWSGEVTFYVNVNNGLIEECPITEWVDFKLYLYDEQTLPTANNNVAMNSTTFVAPRRDAATGKSYSSSADGSWNTADPTSPESLTAADLDVTFNPLTQKFESGTPQLFAKMVADLPPVQKSPDVERLLELNLREAADAATADDRFVVSSGLAMPIRIQNGNQLQWQPNYLNPESVRCKNEDDFEKETLVVYNMTSSRTFRKNEEVMLSRIDGKWIVTQMGIDPSGEEPPPALGEVGRFGEFYYLITNRDGFWQMNENGSSFSPREINPLDIEKRFHSRYYSTAGQTANMAGQPNNSDHDLDTELNYNYNYGASGGYQIGLGFSNVLPENDDTYFPSPLWVQTTSFDYLDSKLCGLRGKKGTSSIDPIDACTIASTNAIINSCGQITEGNPQEFVEGRNAAHTAGFFGCIFPAGYSNAQSYFAAGRDWDVVPFTDGYVEASKAFFNETSSITPDDKPFQVEDTEGFDNWPNVGSSRNLVRQASKNNANEPLGEGQFGPDNTWIRANSKPAGSMFFEETTQGSTVLRHLPADVALNATPSGSNGSPLYSVHELANIYGDTSTISNDAMHPSNNNHSPAQFSSVFKKNNHYLRKRSVGAGAGDPTYSKNDSAFDFRPLGNTLMFRPLKFESYVQFGKYKRDMSEGIVTDAGDPRSPSNLTEATKIERLGFETEINRAMFNFRRPATHAFEDREFLTQNSLLYDANYGLKYGPMTETDTFSNSYPSNHLAGHWRQTEGVGPSTNGDGIPEYGAGFDRAAKINMGWYEQNASFYNSSRPANDTMDDGGFGLGVIATFLTVQASQTIEFVVQNSWGMGAWFEFRNSATPWEARYGWQILGNQATRYKALCVPDLSARVYHEHPRTDMIFDPRYCAVHHFNPNMDHAYDKVHPNPSDSSNWQLIVPFDNEGTNVSSLEPRPARNGIKREYSGQNSDGDPINWYYFSPVPSSTVDMRRISRLSAHNDKEYKNNGGHASDGYYSAQPLSSGDVTFSNATMKIFAGENTSNLGPPLAPEQDWAINTSRVGKLLPYRYTVLEQGIPTLEDNWFNTEINIAVNGLDSNTFPSQTDVDNGASPKFITDFNNPTLFGIVYDSSERESNFAVGDTIGLPNKDVLLRVSAIDEETGQIRKLQIKRRGVNLDNPMSSGTPMLKGHKGPIQLLPITTESGENLNMSFLVSQLHAVEVIDPKPKIMDNNGSPIFSISSTATKPDFSDRSNTDPDPAHIASWIKEDTEVDLVLNPAHRSDNNSYDVFYYFHNDITMTWMSNGPDFYGAGEGSSCDTNNSEQYIQATIRTT